MLLTGAGYNIWADHDEFQFVWKKMKGDFILYTKAEFLGSWVNYHRKVGWMVRKTLDGKSPHVNAVVHGDGLNLITIQENGRCANRRDKIKAYQSKYYTARKKRQYIYNESSRVWRSFCGGASVWYRSWR